MAPKIINPDPFCEVALEELSTGDGQSSGTYAVRMKDAESGDMVMLGGTASRHSENYRLVTNERIYQMAQDILTRTGYTYDSLPNLDGSKSEAITWDGKQFSAKWYIEDIGEDLPAGDEKSRLMLGVEAKNSYDGSTKVGIQFFMMFQACVNQFYSSNLLGGFTFRHHDKEEHTLDQDIEDAVKLISNQGESFTNAIPHIREMMHYSLGRPREMVSRIELDSVDWAVFEPDYVQTSAFQEEVAKLKRLAANPVTVYSNSLKSYLEVREKLKDVWRPSWDAPLMDELNGTGVTHKLERAQVANVETLWGLLNGYTAVTTHHIGGFQGVGISRRVTDRFISMVNKK